MANVRVGPLVRAISTTSVVIWVECSHPSDITLNATPMDSPEQDAVTIQTHTITVGGRFYAAPELHRLQPATWYTYHIFVGSEHTGHTGQILPYQCFRTLNSPETEDGTIRLAYGSCRKMEEPEKDVLRAFAPWLIALFERRETMWPRILLLIGDQIYADEPTDDMVEKHPQLKGGAKTFADFATMYQYTWTHNPDIRQVLAMLPTYMIFDDHEITNNWNIAPNWRARALKRGLEQTLVDGLAAYWLYQGWGNLSQSSQADRILFRIMQQATEHGEDAEDALEALRACIRREIYGEIHLHWHYEIPTTPPIFVADVRADRPALPDTSPSASDSVSDIALDTDAPARIMSREQMDELSLWLYEKNTSLAIIISSVPIVLPPLIGFAEYLMGMRPFHRQIAPLRWSGKRVQRIQQRLAVSTSFDHWPVFGATWHELVQLLQHRQHDIVALSGDVHFSYAIEAHPAHHSGQHSKLYQLVCTPLQNVLSPKNRRMVLRQAHITRSTYGGLRTRMLPMQNVDGTGRIPYDMLLRNTLALVTFQQQEHGNYSISQDYLELRDGHLQVIGYTKITEKRAEE